MSEFIPFILKIILFYFIFSFKVMPNEVLVRSKLVTVGVNG